MTNDNARIAALLREAADRVASMGEDDWVYTVTVTVDGHSQSNVSATIEYQHETQDYLDDRDPIVIH